MRLFLAATTYGTNDVTTWHEFGVTVWNNGLDAVYERYPGANHPPLAMSAAGLLAGINSYTGLPFYFLLKLPGVLADGVTMALVRWRGGILSLAIYSLNPLALLLVGYHGNTDPIVVMCCVAAVVLIERTTNPMAAGLLLGLGANIKFIAVLLVPLVCGYAKRGRVISASAIITLLVAAIGVGVSVAPDTFSSRALGYVPPFEYWGVSLLITMMASPWRDLWSQFPKELVAVYAPFSKLFTLGFSSFMGFRNRSVPAWSGATCIFLVFILLASGFGLQYLLYPLPFLCVVARYHAAAYSLLGAAAGGVLVARFRADDALLLTSNHISTAPPVAMFLLFLLWVVAFDAVLTVYRKGADLADTSTFFNPKHPQ